MTVSIYALNLKAELFTSLYPETLRYYQSILNYFQEEIKYFMS
ncbi:MAG TPA: hypothetical protein PKV04_03095 [Candidatus Marinimicrobia bacterium]|nr:hypothetical protein [Candidatus Neomarinimicrobiota bacterium]